MTALYFEALYQRFYPDRGWWRNWFSRPSRREIWAHWTRLGIVRAGPRVR